MLDFDGLGFAYSVMTTHSTCSDTLAMFSKEAVLTMPATVAEPAQEPAQRPSEPCSAVAVADVVSRILGEPWPDPWRNYRVLTQAEFDHVVSEQPDLVDELGIYWEEGALGECPLFWHYNQNPDGLTELEWDVLNASIRTWILEPP